MWYGAPQLATANVTRACPLLALNRNAWQHTFLTENGRRITTQVLFFWQLQSIYINKISRITEVIASIMFCKCNNIMIWTNQNFDLAADQSTDLYNDHEHLWKYRNLINHSCLFSIRKIAKHKIKFLTPDKNKW